MYTTKQLVGFGNYLLKRYNVMVYSTDGTNTPVYGRQVTDADHVNWEGESEENTAAFASGERVWCSLHQYNNHEPLLKARVLGVHAYNNVIKYDLSLVDGGVEEREYTRIYNVEARFVQKADVPIAAEAADSPPAN